MSDQQILVIGASGKTGSRVANRLQTQGKPVRHGTRGAAIPFDWEDPDTWPAALEGIKSAYVTYFPDLAFPGAVQKIEALCAAASSSGLCHLVLLSGRGEQHAREAEMIVENSGLDYTLVRSSWFAQNFSEGYLRDPILAGILPMPGGDILEPIIDIDDIADVVVAALTQHGHSRQLYEVTGPELLNFADMAQILSREIGRPIQHIPISFENFHANVAEAGGDFVADIFTAIARETLDGRNAEVCDGVQRALGRAPTSFAEFARKTALKGALEIRRIAVRFIWKDKRMPLTLFQKLALGLAGLTAVGIGFTITAIPHMFYTSYGIALGPDASLLSELSRPRAGLTAFGIIMLLGIVNNPMPRLQSSQPRPFSLPFPQGASSVWRLMACLQRAFSPLWQSNS